MIDYIRATLFGCKDTINFVHLREPEGVYASGWVKYHLKGCERLAVWVNRNNDQMRLEGSIAYFMQGHNFTFTRKNLFEGINYINSLLNVNLWHADLESFEYGVICEVESKPKEYITHHYAPHIEKLNLVENAKDNGNYRHWDGKQVKLKMYDAGRNIQHKQDLQRKAIIGDAGWNSEGEYIKWECHYIKPEFLNKGRALKVCDLCSPDWTDAIKEDVYIQYKRLIPMSNIVMPNDKKDLSTSDILLITYAEDSINAGQPICELKKVLYAKINTIPDTILSKADKDARKGQIKKLLDKLEEEPESKWDLSSKIEEALTKECD